MDIDKYLHDEYERKQKESTKMVDAVPLFKMLMHAKETHPEVIDEMMHDLEESYESQGAALVSRALDEGVITMQFFQECQSKGIYESELGTILQAYYGRADGHMPPSKNGEKEVIAVLTAIGSPLDVNRDLFTFLDIRVVNQEEFIVHMMHKHPETIDELKRDNPEATEEINRLSQKEDILKSVDESTHKE